MGQLLGVRGTLCTTQARLILLPRGNTRPGPSSPRCPWGMPGLKLDPAREALPCTESPSSGPWLWEQEFPEERGEGGLFPLRKEGAAASTASVRASPSRD